MILRTPIAFLVLATAVGCAQIPPKELSLYAESYETARVAGDLLLDELAPVIDGERADCDIDPATGFRPCFDLAVALGPTYLRRNEPVDLRIRRTALSTIAAYNQLLVDLAEGRSAAILGARLEEFGDLAGAFTALAGPAAASAAPAVELALIGYVRALDQSTEALMSLTAAIRDPETSTLASTTELIRQTTEARIAAMTFLADVRALRAAAP
ncbi:MAG: hypothetical protein AAF675_08925 [Pseudomonadota bacterium]